MLPYILIVVGFIIVYFAWQVHSRINDGGKPLGIGLAVLLTAMSVVSLFIASIKLNLSPLGTIALFFGTFILSGLVSLFRGMILEGFSSILPKKKSDAIFYTAFFLILIVLLIMSLKAAYNYYVTGNPLRLR